jgi:hypothetical protein
VVSRGLFLVHAIPHYRLGALGRILSNHSFMRLRLVKIDEFQLLTCIRHGLWGAKTARFRQWKEGDRLGVVVDKALAAVGKVSGKPFRGKDKVWDNGEFPNRIKIDFTHYLDPDDRPPVLGDIRQALIELWCKDDPKNRWGYGILNQLLIESPQADIIADAITTAPNALKNFDDNKETILEEARLKRDKAVETASRRKKRPAAASASGEPVEAVEEPSPPSSPKEESAHTLAQGALMEIGQNAGCSVWIAGNDRSKIYKGKPLGEGSLSSLPKMGLSDEAARLISLVDVIWLERGAPVCAFEVESTTSVYSGLLRMSDLLASCPALKIKIFVVAPEERREKVMRELRRPTFQKIGLSDYCKYVSMKDLSALLAKVSELGGGINPQVIENIAEEPEE